VCYWPELTHITDTETHANSHGKGSEKAFAGRLHVLPSRRIGLEDVEQGARGWVGLDEAENPMLVLDRSITDVYRLDMQVP